MLHVRSMQRSQLQRRLYLLPRLPTTAKDVPMLWAGDTLMASGKDHAKASLIASVPTGLVVGIGLSSIPYGIGTAIGSILGIALTPDLDQEMTTFFEWKLIRKTGPLGFLWMAFWASYSLLIPHRSIWSHLPILGTIIRLLYITTPIIAFCLWWDYIPVLPQYIIEGLVGTLIGLSMSDTLHWFMDRCPL